MPSKIYRADSSGVIARVVGNGVGFAVLPAGSAPGALPVTVKTRDGDEWIVSSGRPVYGIEKFDELRIEGATPSSTYNVHIFRDHKEGLGPPGGKRKRSVPVQSATAMGTAAPALSTDGFEVLDGQVGWGFYFSGTLTNTITVWARSIAGVWYDTKATIDPSSEAVATRLSYAPGTRIALVSSAATTNLEIERIMEVE